MSETHVCSQPDCNEPQLVSEFRRSTHWIDSDGVGRHGCCNTCEQKRVAVSNERVNPKNNAISQVMHQRMVGMGIPRTEHYIYEHAELRKRLRKEINMDGSWQKKCIECGDPLISGEDWSEVAERKKRYTHETCNRKRVIPSNKRVNPKNNAISRVMHQRMADQGIPRTEHYTDEHAELRRRLRKEIEKGGSWQKDGQTEPTEPADKPEKPKKIKEKISAGRWVEVKAGRRWCNNSTLSDQRNNLEIRKGVCELSGLEIRFCDTSHLVAQMVCEALGHKEWIEDEGNVVLLDMRFNRAMEFGWAFDETGRFCPPPGEEYPEWMVKLGIPDKRIEVTEARLKFIIRAGAFGG